MWRPSRHSENEDNAIIAWVGGMFPAFFSFLHKRHASYEDAMTTFHLLFVLPIAQRRNRGRPELIIRWKYLFREHPTPLHSCEVEMQSYTQVLGITHDFIILLSPRRRQTRTGRQHGPNAERIQTRYTRPQCWQVFACLFKDR